MRELSIAAAAHDAGDREALRTEARDYTFAELAELAHERMRALAPALRERVPHPVVGATTLDTLLTLYALLELRVPALMLHPRLTAPERDALLAFAGRVGALEHDDAAAVLFTSGTTGDPRGVVLTRDAFVASANASASNLGWRDDDCWLLCMTSAHVGGLSIVTRCLAARRAIALVERFDVERFPRWIDEHRITLASVVPTMLARVLDAHPHWSPPPHLRGVLVGGAAAPAALVARAVERGVPFIVTYGSTETCSQVVATPYADRHRADASGAGVALEGVELRIVDGRICVRGEMLFAGYWGAPRRLRDAWFDTGDAGYVDANGRVHVQGRGSELIVTGGENVYPAEVERVLEALPGVAAAGVFGVPDGVWGEIVAAALVVRAPTDDAAIAAHVEARLARHKRPRRVCFVDELPHTAGGKLDRRTLATLAPRLRPLAVR